MSVCIFIKVQVRRALSVPSRPSPGWSAPARPSRACESATQNALKTHIGIFTSTIIKMQARSDVQLAGLFFVELNIRIIYDFELGAGRH